MTTSNYYGICVSLDRAGHRLLPFELGYEYRKPKCSTPAATASAGSHGSCQSYSGFFSLARTTTSKATSLRQKVCFAAGYAARDGSASLFHKAILEHVQGEMHPTKVFTSCEDVAKKIYEASIQATY